MDAACSIWFNFLASKRSTPSAHHVDDFVYFCNPSEFYVYVLNESVLIGLKKNYKRHATIHTNTCLLSVYTFGTMDEFVVMQSEGACTLYNGRAKESTISMHLLFVLVVEFCSGCVWISMFCWGMFLLYLCFDGS